MTSSYETDVLRDTSRVRERVKQTVQQKSERLFQRFHEYNTTSKASRSDIRRHNSLTALEDLSGCRKLSRDHDVDRTVSPRKERERHSHRGFSENQIPNSVEIDFMDDIGIPERNPTNSSSKQNNVLSNRKYGATVAENSRRWSFHSTSKLQEWDGKDAASRHEVLRRSRRLAEKLRSSGGAHRTRKHEYVEAEPDLDISVRSDPDGKAQNSSVYKSRIPLSKRHPVDAPRNLEKSQSLIDVTSSGNGGHQHAHGSDSRNRSTSQTTSQATSQREVARTSFSEQSKRKLRSLSTENLARHRHSNNCVKATSDSGSIYGSTSSLLSEGIPQQGSVENTKTKNRAKSAEFTSRNAPVQGGRRHSKENSRRNRRALPQVPAATNTSEMEERRKRISAAALKRLQSLRVEVQQEMRDCHTKQEPIGETSQHNPNSPDVQNNSTDHSVLTVDIDLPMRSNQVPGDDLSNGVISEGEKNKSPIPIIDMTLNNESSDVMTSFSVAKTNNADNSRQQNDVIQSEARDRELNLTDASLCPVEEKIRPQVNIPNKPQSEPFQEELHETVSNVLSVVKNTVKCDQTIKPFVDDRGSTSKLQSELLGHDDVSPSDLETKWNVSHGDTMDTSLFLDLCAGDGFKFANDEGNAVIDCNGSVSGSKNGEGSTPGIHTSTMPQVLQVPQAVVDTYVVAKDTKDLNGNEENVDDGDHVYRAGFTPPPLPPKLYPEEDVIRNMRSDVSSNLRSPKKVNVRLGLASLQSSTNSSARPDRMSSSNSSSKPDRISSTNSSARHDPVSSNRSDTISKRTPTSSSIPSTTDNEASNDNNPAKCEAIEPPKKFLSKEELRKLMDDLTEAANKPIPFMSEEFATDVHNTNNPFNTAENKDNFVIDTEKYLLKQKSKSIYGTSSRPPLHKIVQTCDFFSVDIPCDENGDSLVSLRAIECPYYEGKNASGECYCIRPPVGRRQQIGPSSAFLPVSVSANSDVLAVANGGSSQSLLALEIDSKSFEFETDQLLEGDFIIEVNGEFVLPKTLEELQQRLTSGPGPFSLVVARPKTHPAGTTKGDNEGLKELEKLRFKVDSLKAEGERNLDTIAELRLAAQEKDSHIRHLEDKLRIQQTRTLAIEKELRQKENKVMGWKHEVNRRDMELARLKVDVKQKEDKLNRLEKLLAQHRELMGLQSVQNGFLTSDPDYEIDAEVSAV